MLNYLLCSIIVFTLIILYLNYKAGFEEPFPKVLVCYLYITLFHASYTTIALNGFSSEYLFIDRAAPFGLIYGPLFYFGFLAASCTAHRFHLKRIMIHFIPFGIFLICYIFLLLFPFLRNELKYYYICLFLTQSISMIGYASWGIFYKGIQPSGIFKEARRLVGLVSILFIAIGLFFVMIAFKRLILNIKKDSDLPLFIIYISMFSVQYLTFRYTVRRLLHNDNVPHEETMISGVPGHKISKEEMSPQYQKSSVTNELLDEYELRLENLMAGQDIYLDHNLTLDGLSKKLRMPKHHLTQLFSLRIKKNFYQYINTFRIIHACELLKDPKKELTLEELAFESGFNSKTTFNRYFKSQMACTPSDYRSNSLK